MQSNDNIVDNLLMQAGVVTRFVRLMDMEDVPQASYIEREAFPPPWPATNFGHDLKYNTFTTYFVACEEWLGDRGPSLETGAVKCDVRLSESGFEWLRSGIKRLFRGETAVVYTSQLVLGFAAVWFILDEAHISNIAVLESYRRQGIGERLLISIIKLAIERNARYINLEVRVSNKIAQALYRKYGFEEVGMRYGYYLDSREDALLMTADMITSTVFKDNLQNRIQDYSQRWGVII